MSNINGGDSAEQIVRIMFNGMDIALRLTGSATKNLAQLLIMATKNENVKVRRGETTMLKLLKEGKELRTYQMRIDDLSKFKIKAKQYGILFSAIKDVRSDNEICDIILRQEDIPRFNTVVDGLGLDTVKGDTENEKKNDPLNSRLRSSKASFKTIQDKPSVKEKLQQFQDQLKQRKPKQRTRAKGR